MDISPEVLCWIREGVSPSGFDSCPDANATRRALCEERCWSGEDVAKGGGSRVRLGTRRFGVGCSSNTSWRRIARISDDHGW